MMLSTHNMANTAHISAKRMFVFCIFVIQLAKLRISEQRTKGFFSFFNPCIIAAPYKGL